MKRRTIVFPSKTGSITLLQARELFRAVKIAKARKGVSGPKSGRLVSESVRERYLGHFGVGPRITPPKDASSVKKSAAKKSSGKKAAPK